MSLTESTMLAIGTEAPRFSLPDVISGKVVQRDDFRGKNALLIMFICVHCPFVKHIEKDLGALGRDYADKPVGIVAINANDVLYRPTDGPDGMRAQAQLQGFRFPYLQDESQDVARAYKAACTPDFFLFDSEFRLAYRGEYDASRPGNDIAVTGKDLRAAIDAVLAGKAVEANQRPSIGCNIKWKA
jgi:peroxiredoxin